MTVDTAAAQVEIKVRPDPNGGWRVWLHVGGQIVARIYRAEITLDGLAVTVDEPAQQVPEAARFEVHSHDAYDGLRLTFYDADDRPLCTAMMPREAIDSLAGTQPEPPTAQ
jgi:hypothetical protein